MSFAEGSCERHKETLTLCSSTNQSQPTSNLPEYLVFGKIFLQGGVRKYITRSPDLPCSRTDAHAHKKWQCTVPEGEEYRRDKRVCVQVRLSFSTMMFFSFFGGGGDVLIFKQIDGSDLKVRRVGFFKKVTRRK